MGSTGQGIGAVALLTCSNAFMNAAWYLHLKFKSWPLVQAIFLSWLIAFAEYCLQVPANRMGHFSHGGPFTAPQLKTIQEFLSISTFTVFSIAVLKEKLKWSDAVAFGLIFSGVVVSLVFKPKSASDAAAMALPPPPVAPAPEPSPGLPGSASPALPESPGSVGGRKLLQQLLWKGWRRGSSDDGNVVGAGGTAEGVQLSEQHTQERQEAGGSRRGNEASFDSGRRAEEGQHGATASGAWGGRELHQAPQQAQQAQQGQQQGQQPAQQSFARARSSQEREPPLLLQARQPLSTAGSSQVLLASGADPHTSSSRRSTHQREGASSGSGGEGGPDAA